MDDELVFFINIECNYGISEEDGFVLFEFVILWKERKVFFLMV